MQETWVQSLTREDPTGSGATKPIHHNYWATSHWTTEALEPGSTTREVTSREALTLQLEKAHARSEDLTQSKINQQ